jgi:hypothetical protein
LPAIRSTILACAAALAVPALPGCLDGDADSLTIATAWPAPGRARFEESVRQSHRGSTRIRWLLLAPGDDLARLVRRRPAPDLVLGGPASTYEALAAQGLFEPDTEGGPGWGVARRLPFGHPERHQDLGPSLTFDDPRRDPVSLAWAGSVLRSGPWPVGYAGLVRSAGGARPPGRQPGAALAALQRGGPELAPAVAWPWPAAEQPPGEFLQAGDGTGWPEGVAVVRGARHAATAKAVLRDLAASGRVDPPPAPGASSGSESLLADLMGATLVDARAELVAAWDALDAAGRPDRPLTWMTQAPPWPPASVGKILGRESNAMPMLETLIGQIAPDADVRAWLLQSWLSPPRLVDVALLDELAGAVDGRLAREPRFRSWLRSEWTAWARQRYRRVARQAGGWRPPEAGAGVAS